MEISNIMLIISSTFAVALFLWWARRRRHLKGNHAAVARTAIRACNTLLELIAGIQQHRGMSTALLAGDRSFERRLAVKRSEIEPLVIQLQQIAAEENTQSYPCFTPNDVTLWRHRWGTLVSELGSYTVEKSIATHSNLIAMLLNWLDALGEARIGLLMGNTLPDGAVRNFAHRLPQLTETLGQARATGSGVAARGSCPAVARVRLMFLVSRAESLTDQACAADPQGTFAAQKVKALAFTIRSHLLSTGKVGIGAEEYFSEATRAIDSVFHWVHDCGQRLGLAIEQEAYGREPARQAHLQGGK